jgi:hypothetical protein
MAPDLHRRPLRGPSQIESLVWSEGVHLNNSSFVRIDDVPDFNALHSRKHQLYAFNILTLDGEDLRPLPLSLRKTNLARLLARRPFSRSPGTGALRRDRARARGGRAAAWSTIHADSPAPSPSGTTAMSTKLSLSA